MWLTAVTRIVLVFVLLLQFGGGLSAFTSGCPLQSAAVDACCGVGEADVSSPGQPETPPCACLLCADQAIVSAAVPSVERSVLQHLPQPIAWQREVQLLRPRFVPGVTLLAVIPRASTSPPHRAFVSVVILRC